MNKPHSSTSAPLPGSEALRLAEPVCEPTHEEVDAFLQLIGNFGRTKLSLDSLMLRPIWHDHLITQLQDAGVNTDEGETPEQRHWIMLFFRLGKLFQGGKHSGSVNMRLLAEHFGVPMSSATRMADQLVQRGLLERYSDQQDRRVVLLRLSSSGERALGIIYQATRERMKLILQQFSPEERRQILTLGGRLFQMWNASLTHNETHQTPSPRPGTGQHRP